MLGDNLYLFGGKYSNSDTDALKYSIIEDDYTFLEDVPNQFYDGSAIVLNENEIALIGVIGMNTSAGIYKYNIAEDTYNAYKCVIDKSPSNTKINNYAYIIQVFDMNTTEFQAIILTKYNTLNNCFYSYNVYLDELHGLSDFLQVANANNNLYLVTKTKLYKAKIIANYEGDGIYVISQEASLFKDMNISNILEVKKIINKEEQTIEVYIGDGEKWNLLN